jgi:polysaccharide deacetylase family protein (PEP-CTERM system associated)
MNACALSIDLEDWHHPELVRRHRPPQPVARVATATWPILELLARHRCRATFFVVGEVARRHPALIEAIAARGHEIGCHGMTHRPLGELGPAGLTAELEEFAVLLRGILGPDLPLAGFRAPSFSLEPATAWALPILARHGYRYDASLFPVRTPLYGVAGARLELHRDGALVEVPAAIAEVAGLRLPVGGGAYLRVLPGWVSRWLLARIRRDRPFVIYVHPWETDARTPRLPLSRFARAVTYAGIGGALGKLDALVAAFPFVPVVEVVDQWLAR